MRRRFQTLLFLTSGKLWAAACCGGASSFPSLILSDDRAQLGATASAAKVIGDAPVDGRPVFRSASDQEWSQTYALDGAALLSDRWQVGAKLPFVARSRSTRSQRSSDSGWGDVTATTGYEFLPEFYYSRWKPRGFSFVQVTLPTGGNVYTSRKTYAVDARGLGFYTVSTGVFLMKAWGNWDSSLRLGVGKSLNRAFVASDGSRVYVRPGWDLTAAASAGYSPGQGDFRGGINVNPLYSSPSNVASHKLVWNVGVDLTYLVARVWALSLGYADQTLLGPAENTSLQRSGQVSLRYKWER